MLPGKVQLTRGKVGSFPSSSRIFLVEPCWERGCFHFVLQRGSLTQLLNTLSPSWSQDWELCEGQQGRRGMQIHCG